MSQSLARRGFSLVKMLLVVAFFILAISYATVALSAQDPFWFLSGFTEEPYRIIVYHDGQSEEYWAGQPGFDRLAEAIHQSLNEGVERQSGIGMGDLSMQEALEKYVTVEAFFAAPVKLHAGFNTGRPTQMLFPITGRHSNMRIVVLGDQNGYWVNPPVLKNVQPIRAALAAMNIGLE